MAKKDLEHETKHIGYLTRIEKFSAAHRLNR